MSAVEKAQDSIDFKLYVESIMYMNIFKFDIVFVVDDA